MEWANPICSMDWRAVRVSYKRYDKNSIYGGHFVFGAESLSRSGLNHVVYIKVNDKYYLLDPNIRSTLTPQQLIYDHYVKVWSSDEYFKYGGCQYNQTQLGNALIAEFRVPKPEHDYVVSHSLWAVLAAFLESEGADRENFSKIYTFDGERYE